MNIVEFTNKIFKKLKIKHEDEERLYRAMRTKKWATTHKKLSLEADEFIGDKFLQYTMAIYCNSTPPYCNFRNYNKCEALYSRLVIKYLNSEHLCFLCKKIGLNKYADYTSYEDIDMVKIYEDIFEAWIGACSQIYGYEETQNYVFTLFDSLEMDISYDSLYDARTQLNDYNSQNYKKYKLFTKEQTKTSNGFSVTLAIDNTVDKELITFTGYGDTMKKADHSAASGLLNKIKKCRFYLETISHVASYNTWKSFNSILKRNCLEAQEKEPKKVKCQK